MAFTSDYKNMKNEPKTLKQYSSYLEDEHKLDARIAHEGTSAWTIGIVILIYMFVSFSSKNYSSYSKEPPVNALDISLGVIF